MKKDNMFSLIGRIGYSRRAFLKRTAVSAGGAVLFGCGTESEGDLLLGVDSLLGGLKEETGPVLIEGARWFRGDSVGDGLLYRFEPGGLAAFRTLTTDVLLDGKNMAAFLLTLQEGASGPAFKLNFKLLNQCSARIRVQLEWLNQNQWKIPREGAWLKPIVFGDRVNLEDVDRLTVEIFRNGGRPVRWCIQDIRATNKDVMRMEELVLPEGPLLDELGQSTLHVWPAKSRSVEEVASRLRKQLAEADTHRWPSDFSRWGGWKRKRVKATGFFRRELDGERWWLVDPEGYLFWSAGLDCVRVDTLANIDGIQQAAGWLPEQESEFSEAFADGGASFNWLAANLIRTFGEEWRRAWAEISLGELHRIGFNTVGNWSEWEIAREAQIPYVRPLRMRLSRTKRIYRDFPDVFSPDFESDASEFAGQLAETADDPALLGYFLMNEPTWGFSSELPAVGMLYNTEECETRKVLSEFLGQKYGSDSQLSETWGMEASFESVAGGRWQERITDAALRDLSDFSEQMVERFFRVLTDACKNVDPNHLNLGARYHTVPPDWALKGMKHFDVFSMNCYREKVPFDQVQDIHEKLGLPVMIGEFHFGALDVGLPATGIGHVKDQQARGDAYRVYVEDAAANPWCVGTHYFTQYDQSALGRFDGENYNIGFLDVCNRPYETLVNAARKTHEAMYEVAAGEREPFNEAPEYFPKLF